tara:strand:- start:2535 stop:3056 length:522 start_codon:yes stop_codon:yes gene_type:complete
MAGSLIKLSEEEVTSAVSSVTLSGLSSIYSVHMVVCSGIEVDTNGGNIRTRLTQNGIAQTGANYDVAGKQLRTNTTFSNSSSTNQTSFAIHFAGGTVAGEANNFTYTLFDFVNADEYSFITFEETGTDQNAGILTGNTGGGVHTVQQSNDGLQFFSDTGNIDKGVFTLYGLRK